MIYGLTVAIFIGITAFAQDRVAIPGPAASGAATAHGAREFGEIRSLSCNGEVTRKGLKIKIKSLPFKVHENDEIRCDGTGEMNLKMIDKTDLKIYPNGGIVIEEYLLHPDNMETFSMRILGGAFRFASEAMHGKVDRYRFDTSTGIIGVRGTVFTADVTAERTKVAVERGEVRVVHKKTKQERFIRTGQKAEINQTGISP